MVNLPRIPPWLETVLRIIQFGAALASLIIWAIYISNVVGGGSSPMKAVLGIVIAGTIWTASAVLQWAWKHRQSKKGKSVWGAAIGIIIAIAIIDFLFIVLFATVAGLVGSSGNGSGGCRVAREDGTGNEDEDNSTVGCGQGKAVFGLAIVNVFSFTGSSVMNIIQSTQRPPNPKSMYDSGKHVGTAMSNRTMDV